MLHLIFDVLKAPFFKLTLSLCFAWLVSSSQSQQHLTYLDGVLNYSFPFDTLSPLKPLPGKEINPADVWKQWNVVENFTFGKDRGDISMIADVQALHPYLRDRILKLISICQSKGIELAIVESYRTRAKQAEYFGMGRKYTRSAGGQSKHQYGLAVDVVPMIDSVAQWDNKVLWRKVGVIGESLGLRWGGRWRHPYDPAHFEWTGGLTSTHFKNGIYPAVPRQQEVYPCIEEDLAQLKKYWDAWEAEQSVMARGK